MKGEGNRQRTEGAERPRLTEGRHTSSITVIGTVAVDFVEVLTQCSLVLRVETIHPGVLYILQPHLVEGKMYYVLPVKSEF